ncbi:hypothetical protein PVL29_010981 [Vitis rotundifolia]|uniref:Uncharacterized protein n=1 Tax=Vitis rotundifolia TaxID=103349 RepID=A0AA38ZV28_VITRO|nr:hypothetical protein PVL29_010981 [Vitis rotundifolia]
MPISMGEWCGSSRSELSVPSRSTNDIPRGGKSVAEETADMNASGSVTGDDRRQEMSACPGRRGWEDRGCYLTPRQVNGG